eukprot:TRINITY_DN2538_c0_g1_i1.p1 TRINITY_DN2538_c0_g1~~TRINITY_DN2538_c0_g1_i1.p1  ORF type:complete len:580 (-),score=210.13 TRINITY_DN2538_c0_g1_i1:94-1833(-)
MATLTSILPAPIQPVFSTEGNSSSYRNTQTAVRPVESKHIPPYGKRQGFVPRAVEDFGDGGAFPEIHVAQYPLDMGRKKSSSSSQQIVPLTMDGTGKFKHDAILGARKDKKVFASFTDLIETQGGAEAELAKPTEDEVEATTAKTRAALEQLVNFKIQAAQPSAPVGKGTGAPTYIKYTPAQQGPGFNSGASNRVIRMVELPKDPFEPPKFKNKKVPRGPPSPPVPVMHSPPRKVTAKDQSMWKIPPCISNWKNSKGYTIPLDKRLAADGRGLQEVQINDKFAKLSESLYVAERTARDEVTQRNEIMKKLSLRQKEQKEETLRKLAEDARMNRGPLGGGGGVREAAPEQEDEYEEEEETLVDRRERDKIREDRARERQRELRLEAAGKKGKGMRDEDRDVSEKIALGLGGGGGPRSEEGTFDQRLFNQTQGMEGGFGDDDSYNLYSKPLFASSTANAMYRPRKNQEDFGDEQMDQILSTNKFRPDKGFQGATSGNSSSDPRNKPVEFEKDAPESDPFGLNEFLNAAKESSSNKRPLDKIGNRGTLHAGSAGGADFGDGGSAKRKRIDFDNSSSSSNKRR